jgi:hypothetical protein
MMAVVSGLLRRSARHGGVSAANGGCFSTKRAVGSERLNNERARTSP